MSMNKLKFDTTEKEIEELRDEYQFPMIIGLDHKG